MATRLSNAARVHELQTVNQLIATMQRAIVDAVFTDDPTAQKDQLSLARFSAMQAMRLLEHVIGGSKEPLQQVEDHDLTELYQRVLLDRRGRWCPCGWRIPETMAAKTSASFIRLDQASALEIALQCPNCSRLYTTTPLEIIPPRDNSGEH